MSPNAQALQVQDTRARALVPLTPVSGTRTVSIYSCGPTVYQQAHIGNMRAYVFADTLNRTLRFLGYTPKHIINLTDVGHLTDDADEGEDKIEKQAAKEKISVWEIADKNIALFFRDLEKLHIPKKHYTFPRATEYIAEQIALISRLEAKGYTYRIDDGIYFDTKKFAPYGALTTQQEKEESVARIDEVHDKKHFQDFALWKFTPAGVRRQQEWDSPWGKGFPGWHIECSAMAMSLLGDTIDIHTGGIDHIPIHHTNEIAQTEAVTGKTFAHLWLHTAFLNIKKTKLSKSLGNAYTLDDLEEEGYHPLDLRYLFLQTNYHTPLSFSFEALRAAQTARKRLQDEYEDLLRRTPLLTRLKNRLFPPTTPEIQAFQAAMRDNLNTAKALGILWETLQKKHPPARLLALLTAADSVFAILHPLQKDKQESSVPPEVEALLQQRFAARQKKDFVAADALRDKIEAMGYRVVDTPEKCCGIKK